MNERDARVAFWRTVARELGVGTQLQVALEQGLVRLRGTELEGPVQAVITSVVGGATLSAAMEKTGKFERVEIAMVRAGEAGGVLDICVRRLVDGLAEGTLIPNEAQAPGARQASFWWALGCMVSSGVPLVEALDVEMGSGMEPSLLKAVEAMKAAAQRGEPVASAMRDRGDVFAPDVVGAIEEAERRGELDVVAMRLGERLAAGGSDGGATPAPTGAQEAHARKLVNMILLQSVKDKATDVHFDPDGKNGRLRYRIDGRLWEMLPPPPGLYGPIVDRVKFMANLDLHEKRVPQTGRILLSLNNEKVDLRVSTIPVYFGERLVLRILRQDGMLLNLSTICDDDARKLSRMRQLISRPQGMVICTGATGSGKTTLLYALLQELNRPERSIMSIEDPVEVALDGVAQVQVSPQAGLTMSAALRQVLRQDTDVIMVGEIRDLETLQACAVAASVGRLVLTTLHTNLAVPAIQRMLELGLQPHLLNGALAGVVAQRLVRKLCPNCRKPVQPPVDLLPADAARALGAIESPTFFSATGCETCHGTGYTSRIAVHEVLVCDDALRRAIRDSADKDHLQIAAENGGMTPLLVDALQKAAAGITSVEELMQVVAATSP